MKKVLWGLMGLSLMILIASAYSITRLQLQTSTTRTSERSQSTSELSKIEKRIASLKSEMTELENLEKKIQSARLDEALSLGVELNQKLKSYSSIQALQADLRLLNELKTEFQDPQSQDMKTSTSETL